MKITKSSKLFIKPIKDLLQSYEEDIPISAFRCPLCRTADLLTGNCESCPWVEIEAIKLNINIYYRGEYEPPCNYITRKQFGLTIAKLKNNKDWIKHAIERLTYWLKVIEETQ